MRSKIIVKKDWEITDLVGAIIAERAKYLVLTFAEPSDILISPVTLKMLLKQADKHGKILIAQIIQNPTGVRNAKSAGLVAITSAEEVGDDIWQKAEQQHLQRIGERAKKLKASITKDVENLPVENISADGIVKGSDNSQIKDVEEKLQVVEDKNKSVVRKKNLMPSGKEHPKTISEFQKRVNEALRKSKIGTESEKKVIETDTGIKLAINSDIKTSKVGNKKGAAKVSSTDDSDFISKYGISLLQPSYQRDKKKQQQYNNESVQGDDEQTKSSLRRPITKKRRVSGFKQGGHETLKGIPHQRSLLKLLYRIVPLVLITMLVVSWLALTLMPSASVTIFVDSKPLSVEKTFKGAFEIEEPDLNQGVVPIKRVSIEKSSTDYVNATEKKYRGGRAEGVVTMKYFVDNTITIPAGTVITADGLSFKTKNDLTMTGPYQDQVAVIAIDVGEEYNLPAGKVFTVSGYQASDLIAENASAFSGGFKEEYTALSQKDVDGVVKKMKETLKQDINSEFQAAAINGWKLAEKSAKYSVDKKDIKTDVPVGAETDVANVTIKMKGSILLYKEDSLSSLAEELLRAEASRKKLFDSENRNIKLLDVASEVSLTKITNDMLEVKLKASGVIKPDVDVEVITENLRGKKWDEGLAYLEGLSYSEKKAVATYYPEYFPRFVWKFPENGNKIFIRIRDVNDGE